MLSFIDAFLRVQAQCSTFCRQIFHENVVFLVENASILSNDIRRQIRDHDPPHIIMRWGATPHRVPHRERAGGSDCPPPAPPPGAAPYVRRPGGGCGRPAAAAAAVDFKCEHFILHLTQHFL
jgi:hypothetical protein